MILNFLVEHLLPRLEHLGLWGYWAVLLIAFLESVAFVGILIPGSTIIILVGFLASEGFLDIGDLIWFTAVGAILGDSVSYYLGTKGKQFFPKEGRFLKQQHFDVAERFFARHGNKSVFLGRFIPPVRPFTPFLAGFSKMSLGIFLLWDTASGILWAISHLLLGYFFGDVVGQFSFWSKWVSVGLGIILFLIVAWFVARRGKGEKVSS